MWLKPSPATPEGKIRLVVWTLARLVIIGVLFLLLILNNSIGSTLLPIAFILFSIGILFLSRYWPAQNKTSLIVLKIVRLLIIAFLTYFIVGEIFLIFQIM